MHTPPQALDPTYLSDIFEAGGEALVREVVGTFLEDAPGRLAALHDAVVAADWAGAAHAAHGIVSGASMLGLTEVTEAARECEHIAMRGIQPPGGAIERLGAAVSGAGPLLTATVDRLAKTDRDARGRG